MVAAPLSRDRNIVLHICCMLWNKEHIVFGVFHVLPSHNQPATVSWYMNAFLVIAIFILQLLNSITKRTEYSYCTCYLASVWLQHRFNVCVEQIKYSFELYYTMVPRSCIFVCWILWTKEPNFPISRFTARMCVAPNTSWL